MALEKVPQTGEIWTTRNQNGIKRYYLVLKNFGIHVSYLNLMCGKPEPNWVEVSGLERYRWVDPSRIGFRYCENMEDFVGDVQPTEIKDVFAAIRGMYSSPSM